MWWLMAAHAGEPSVVPLAALQPAPPREQSAPVAALLSDVSITARPEQPAAELSLSATLLVLTPGVTALPLGLDHLVIGTATLDGEPIGLAPDGSGQRWLVEALPVGPHRLAVEGVLPSPGPSASMSLPEVAVRLRLEADGMEVTAADGVVLSESVRALPPSADLDLSWRPAGPPPSRVRRVLTEVAMGLVVAEEGIEGRGEIRGRVIDGSLSELTIALTGAVDWAEASGAAVAGSRLEGERLVVSLIEPISGAFSLAVDLRGPPPDGDLPLLLPRADAVSGWVSLHTGGEDYLERDDDGLALLAPAQVPEWGRGLVSGQLAAAWRYDSDAPELTVRAQRHQPLEGPGTLVDEAAMTIGYAAHGRSLSRARLTVRNDRAQYLPVALPPGSVLLSVRVAGRVVEVVSEGERLLVPLEKSIESLQGLVSFPVELTWLAEAPKWSGRGEVSLAAPRIGAEVAQARLELVLPPGVRPRKVASSATVVEEWRAGEGLEYGRATTVFSEKTEQADALMSEAYAAYRDSRFDEASDLLEATLRYDPDNDAAQAMQDNVAVLLGGVEGEEAAEEKRIKAMARARSQEAQKKQEDLIASARSSARAGDVAASASQLSSALQVAEDLARLEDDDSYVQKAVVEDLRRELEAVGGPGEVSEPEVKSAGIRGQLKGIITDEGGIVIPGVVVEIDSEWASKRIQTDVSGRFQSPDLPAGAYTVTIHRAGFSVLRYHDVLINVGRSTVISAELQLESGGEEMLIMESRGVIDFSGDRGWVVSRQMLDRMPSGRTVLSGVGLPGESLEGTGGSGPPRRRRTRAAEPEVTASSLGVMVPVAGEILRLERQLVPADEPITVQVRYR